MQRTLLIGLFVFGLVLSWSMAFAEEGFYVIPVKKRNFAPVEKTGQTKCYDEYGTEIGCSGTGQDGEHQKGVAFPTPRFKDNQNGTVTDNLTGLIWLKDASCGGSTSWGAALSTSRAVGDGYCGVTDGSSAGDWRLPNLKELLSLNVYDRVPMTLPWPFPFVNPWQGAYWSSTTHAGTPSHAWGVVMNYGNVYHYDKLYATEHIHLWPVRGGN